jgi:hypothetical protein
MIRLDNGWDVLLHSWSDEHGNEHRYYVRNGAEVYLDRETALQARRRYISKGEQG